MQLDRTGIVIRERGMFDVLDLALRVITRYRESLWTAWGVVVAVLMLLNYLVLRGVVTDFESGDQVLQYLHAMIMLVIIQAPLATLLTTVFLGRAVFLADSRLHDWLQVVWKNAWSLIWYLGISRAALLGWVLILFFQDVGAETNLMLFLLAAYAVIRRIVTPFMPEIILLEGNPMRAKSPVEMTIQRRSNALHRPNLSDLFGRWVGAAAIGCGIFCSVMGTVWFLSGMVLMDWTWGPIMVYLVLPFALWMAVGFLGVVRFLSYIDLRIRCEGWEVELLLRAAAEQLPEHDRKMVTSH